MNERGIPLEVGCLNRDELTASENCRTSHW